MAIAIATDAIDTIDAIDAIDRADVGVRVAKDCFEMHKANVKLTRAVSRH